MISGYSGYSGYSGTSGVVIPPELQQAFEEIKDKPVVHGKTFEVKFAQHDKKGRYGEGLVVSTLKAKQWEHSGPIVYGAGKFSHGREGERHTFDHYFTKQNKFFLGDSKAKARLNKAPFTGVNWQHFTRYWEIFSKLKKEQPEEFLDFRLFFIDEMLRRIYSVSFVELKLLDLEQLYHQKKTYIETDTVNNKQLIMFHESLWHRLRDLTEEEVKELKELSNRNYNYSLK